MQWLKDMFFPWREVFRLRKELKETQKDLGAHRAAISILRRDLRDAQKQQTFVWLRQAHIRMEEDAGGRIQFLDD